MNYISGFTNFIAELMAHVSRYFLLWLAYKYVLTSIRPDMPSIDWRWGIAIYCVFAVAFAIDLRFGSD